MLKTTRRGASRQSAKKVGLCWDCGGKRRSYPQKTAPNRINGVINMLSTSGLWNIRKDVKEGLPWGSRAFFRVKRLSWQPPRSFCRNLGSSDSLFLSSRLFLQWLHKSCSPGAYIFSHRKLWFLENEVYLCGYERLKFARPPNWTSPSSWFFSNTLPKGRWRGFSNWLWYTMGTSICETARRCKNCTAWCWSDKTNLSPLGFSSRPTNCCRL